MSKEYHTKKNKKQKKEQKNFLTEIKNIFCTFLSLEALQKISKLTGLVYRERAFDIGLFFMAAMQTLNQNSSFALGDLYSKYKDLCRDKGVTTITLAAFYKRLDHFEFPIWVEALLNQVANAMQHSLCSKTGAEIVELFQKMMPEIEDIIPHDGSEISVDPQAPFFRNQAEECKGSTRPKIKCHGSFSLKYGTFKKVSLTAGTASERRQIDPQVFSNRLGIFDRGYLSTELFTKISQAGGRFICRSSKTINPKILSMRTIWTDDSVLLIHDNFLGRPATLKDIQPLPGMISDLDVKFKDGSVWRLLKYCVDPKEFREADNEGFIYLITNLPRDSVPARVICEAYRLRWQIEIEWKCLKSNNSMSSYGRIKNLNIIRGLVLLSCLSQLLKIALGQELEKFYGQSVSHLKMARGGGDMLIKIVGHILELREYADIAAHYEEDALKDKLTSLQVSDCSDDNKKSGKSIFCTKEILSNLIAGAQQRLSTPTVQSGSGAPPATS